MESLKKRKHHFSVNGTGREERRTRQVLQAFPSAVSAQRVQETRQWVHVNETLRTETLNSFTALERPCGLNFTVFLSLWTNETKKMTGSMDEWKAVRFRWFDEDTRKLWSTDCTSLSHTSAS